MAKIGKEALQLAAKIFRENPDLLTSRSYPVPEWCSLRRVIRECHLKTRAECQGDRCNWFKER